MKKRVAFMKKLLLILLFINSIFANDFQLIDNFIKGKDYEKEIDKLSLNNEFINNMLKNKNLKYGFYQNPSTLILCIKSKKEITILDVDTNISTKMNFSILTGENSGDKWIEGDGKTPIGSYKLQYFLKDNQIDDYYGSLAYPTNYPNSYDQYLGKSGHGIWIHGLPKNKTIEKFDTKGCIALKNGDLIKFHNLIDYKKSILFIDENELPTTDKKEIFIILKSLMEWRYAWKYNDLDRYLSFYNKDSFKKENRYGYSYFKSIKKNIFKRNDEKSIKISDIKIIPYPNSQNKKIFKLCFYEEYKSSRFNFTGRKELYLTIQDNKIAIFLEN
jgi:murein L,D-transpeptidase YafK